MAAYPSLEEFVSQIDDVEPADEARPFDRMMYDVCGEVNHVRAAASRIGGDVDGALRAFDRACARVYADPEVTPQRKWTLRVEEWAFKLWCAWGVPGMSRESACRWFDAWLRERNPAVLAL